MIKKGTLVVCNYNFDREREAFGYNYPREGDILTVLKNAVDMEGETVLWFDDLKIPVPLYENCFTIVQDEFDGDRILNEAYKIANNI